MHQHASQWEFYYKAAGWELHNLPDIPIAVHPLINTSLHALADASIADKKTVHVDSMLGPVGTDPCDLTYVRKAILGDRYDGVKVHVIVPQWTFKVRHSGGWKQVKRSPKVSLYLDGGKHICFNFKISSRPVYKNIEEVFDDIRAAKFEFASVNLSARATVPMDELSSMQRWNAQRHDELVRLNAIPKAPVRSLPTADVYDFTAIRAAMVPIISTAERMATLPLYAGSLN